MMAISIRRLDPGLPIPSYAHAGDAGADLCSAVDLTLQPGERALVSTGIAMALPEGYVALVHPRSGLAARHGISIVNAPGTIDAGYRGEVKVCLVNTDLREAFTVRRGDRIAQLVIQRFESAAFVEAEDLPESARGAGGYGSTGGFSGPDQTSDRTTDSAPGPADPQTNAQAGPQMSPQTSRQTPDDVRAGRTTT